MIDTAHITWQRYRKDLSLVELGRRVGCTADHLCKLEHGKIGLSTRLLIALCRELETEPNKIIRGWE